MSLDQLYITHQPVIERILRFIARRHRCDQDEAKDFAAWARLKLVDNDSAILAAYQGRADMGSYLLVVVQRLFLDYRTSKWGAWRPSAEAKRLGPLAVRLETMMARDELSFEEAFQSLRARDPELSREKLEDLQARLPLRLPRRFEGESALETMAASEALPEQEMIEAETAERKRRASAVVSELLQQLEPQEQLILRLRFVEQMQIADVARTLHLDARRLYRRIEGLLADLRRGLAARGLTGEDLGWAAGTRTERASCVALQPPPTRVKTPPRPSPWEGDEVRMNEPCPSAETLAAYGDGKLTPAERREVEKHIAACEDCFELFAGAAAYRLEEAAEGAVIAHLATGRPRLRRWYAAAAAAAIVVAVWAVVRQQATTASGGAEVLALVQGLGGVEEFDAAAARAWNDDGGGLAFGGGLPATKRAFRSVSISSMRAWRSKRETRSASTQRSTARLCCCCLATGPPRSSSACAILPPARAANSLDVAPISTGWPLTHAASTPKSSTWAPGPRLDASRPWATGRNTSRPRSPSGSTSRRCVALTNPPRRERCWTSGRRWPTGTSARRVVRPGAFLRAADPPALMSNRPSTMRRVALTSGCLLTLEAP